MAGYYHGGRAMYSNTDDECYDAGRHGGSMRAHSRTDEYYDNVQDDRIRRPAAYADDDCGYGGRQTAVYTDEYSRGGYGGYGGEQEHFKREEKEHKNKERLGEVGALAGGAFALYEGHRAKQDPANAQRHKIEAGVAAAAALGGGGYAYHEHREQKAAHYETKQQEHRVPHGYYSN
ncbi:abscisic stress-ripening protein 5-like [Miscanthus floridulus]|uniref:abscisic stress-ripening protein 5-like n=1 Tax=Miscanthus floridulus TaxID=154761 RepID=UPI003457DDC0